MIKGTHNIPPVKDVNSRRDGRAHSDRSTEGPWADVRVGNIYSAGVSQGLEVDALRKRVPYKASSTAATAPTTCARRCA